MKKTRKAIVHWQWQDEDGVKGNTFCGKEVFLPHRFPIAKHLKDVTCKKCQAVYMKCEREGYWD